MNFRRLLFWLNDQGTYRHTLGGLCVILATWFAFLDQRTLCWSIAMEHFCLSVCLSLSSSPKLLQGINVPGYLVLLMPFVTEIE